MMTQPDSWNWTFSLVMPDGVISRLVSDIADRFSQRGLVVEACHLMTVQLDSVVRMYEEDTFDRARPTNKLIERPALDTLYSLGPVVIVVLSNAQTSAVRLAREAKGATEPTSAAPHTVRAIGENAMLNLVHTPDDHAVGLRQLRVLAGRAWVDRIAANLPSSAARRSLLAATKVDHMYPKLEGPEAVSISYVLNRLHRRIVSALAASVADVELGALVDAAAALEEERIALTAALTAEERLGVTRRFMDGVHEPLKRCARRVDDVYAVRALDAMSFVTGAKGEPSALVRILDQFVHVSPLERSVISIHASCASR